MDELHPPILHMFQDKGSHHPREDNQLGSGCAKLISIYVKFNSFVELLKMNVACFHVLNGIAHKNVQHDK